LVIIGGRWCHPFSPFKPHSSNFLKRRWGINRQESTEEWRPDTTLKKTYPIFVFSVKIETALKAISTIIYLKPGYGEITKRIHNFRTGGIAG
jgi:hypothetical protein